MFCMEPPALECVVRKLSLLSEALLRLRTVVAPRTVVTPRTAVALKAAIALRYRCQAVVNFKQSVHHGCGGITVETD
jgi:hypothetical protein